jgi:hypothetical protein
MMKDFVGNGLESWFHRDIVADFREEISSDFSEW